MINEDLAIDPANLDVEWLQQPLRFDEAQYIATDQLKYRDELKNELETLKAETSDKIRRGYKNMGLDKTPTAGAVTEMVLLDENVKDLTERLFQTQHQLNLANNTVRSFDMRKKALEKLTDLHISNYFSVPNPGHLVDGGKHFYEAQTQKVEENSKNAVDSLNENKKKRKKQPEKHTTPKNEIVKEGEAQPRKRRTRRA
jgi:hypothetical protein